jgi:hypothetical protein
MSRSRSMTLMSLVGLLAPALALLLAPAPAAPVPRVLKPGDSYFPTRIGAKRVYRAELSKSDVDEVVEDVETKDGEAVVTIRRDPNNAASLPKQEKVAVSAKGLARVEESGEPLRPPVWLLKLPHQPGAKWDGGARSKSTYTVGEAAEVEVPAGKFKAIPVTRHETQINFPVQTTDWYAPGVGLVKRVVRGNIETTILVLKSYTTAEEMEEAVRKLRAVFTDGRQTESEREVAIRKLLRIGPAARWAIPDLVRLLDDPKTPAPLRSAAVAALTSMGPRAAPAVPVLVRALERSAAQWEQLRAAPAHRAVGSAAVWLDGWDEWRKKTEQERQLPPSFPKTTDIFEFDFWMGRKVDEDVGGILAAFQAIGPAAAPAVEPLKRYREKVRGRSLMLLNPEKAVSDALTAILVGK